MSIQVILSSLLQMIKMTATAVFATSYLSIDLKRPAVAAVICCNLDCNALANGQSVDVTVHTCTQQIIVNLWTLQCTPVHGTS